jgi:hypothetical protein
MEAAESSISHRRQVWTKDYLFLQSPQPINQTTSHNKTNQRQPPATSHNQPNIASLRCILSINRIDGSCFFRLHRWFVLVHGKTGEVEGTRGNGNPA